jgi:hypothetical protein
MIRKGVTELKVDMFDDIFVSDDDFGELCLCCGGFSIRGMGFAVSCNKLLGKMPDKRYNLWYAGSNF